MLWSEECLDNQDSPRNSHALTPTVLKGCKPPAPGIIWRSLAGAGDKGDPEWGKNGLLSSTQRQGPLNHQILC